jgi:hypothetical protein
MFERMTVGRGGSTLRPMSWVVYAVIATIVYAVIVLGIARFLSWRWHPDGGDEAWQGEHTDQQ